MIKFACESCGRPIRVEARHAGKKGKCPKCGSVVTVPERSTIISFPCGTCGRKIEVPERHAGKKGRCPQCGNAVVVPSGAEEAVGAGYGDIPPDLGASLPSDTQEDGSEESSGTEDRPAGPDRRLIVLIAAIAAVVVVGSGVLFLALRSSGSPSAEGRTGPRGQREAIAMDLPAQPVAAVASPGEPLASEPERADGARQRAIEPRSAAEAAGAVRLQFCPAPGTKRRVQLDMVLAISMEIGGQQHQVTNSRSLEWELEVAEWAGDGAVKIGIHLASLREKSGMQGQILGEYDSAQPRVPGDPLADTYAAFLDHRFTMVVSSKGEILEPGLEGLFRAAAERRVQAEDDMVRERRKEKADQAIRKMDERLGSRENRVLAIKKQMEEFPVFGKEQIADLLNSLMVVLPDQPVRGGDTWEGSLPVGAGEQMQMAATYTLTAVEQDHCTIEATGETSLDEDPVASQTGQANVDSKVTGSSRGTLQIERRTGWLLRKEQKTKLQGETTTMAASQPQDAAVQGSMEITSTLTTLR